MVFIGVDIGTTSICGVSVSEDAAIIKSVTKPNSSFIKTENEYERIQDPAVIIAAVNSILEELEAAKADAIGFSGQMHGILYTDIDGNAVSPLYIWQDERANLEYKDGVSYAEHFGAHAGYGLATDFYNEINGIVPESARYLCTVADYAVMKLCGLKMPVMHITNAASLGRFDIDKNSFTFNNPRLPQVAADFRVCGEWNSVPVSIALGDNQASFIGSVRNPADALLNVGTGAQISWLSAKPVSADVAETRPFDGKRYLAAGCSLCGGRAFAMLEKFMRQTVELATGEKCESYYPYLNKLLEDKTETTLRADCRFCGTRNDPSLRGSYLGISENNFTPADFAFATLEGIAQELYSMYAPEEKGSLVCSGNGIRKNAALRRIVAAKFESDVKIPLYEEEAAYGAALSSMTAAGVCSSIDEACSKIRYKDE